MGETSRLIRSVEPKGASESNSEELVSKFSLTAAKKETMYEFSKSFLIPIKGSFISTVEDACCQTWQPNLATQSPFFVKV